MNRALSFMHRGSLEITLTVSLIIIFFSYMTQVDRCLRGFESTTEWADLIAALTKLNKVNFYRIHSDMDPGSWIRTDKNIDKNKIKFER